MSFIGLSFDVNITKVCFEMLEELLWNKISGYPIVA